jgi:RNA polymerase sigma-70 factor (ECF subfamily)
MHATATRSARSSRTASFAAAAAAAAVTAGATAAAAPAFTAALPLAWADLAPQRGYLVAYARRRLQDPALAEDLVHDVFEAVITGRARFEGRAALRTWLVGILKHKIVDLVRQRSGHDSLDAGCDDDDGSSGSEPTHPALHSTAAGPDEVAEQRQRLQQTLQRIAALPDSLRQVVELRLLHDRSSAEVCQTLRITEQNLFVRLHRARRVLLS